MSFSACAPGSIEFQKHRRFVREWVSSKNRRLLLFHGLGGGKTATGILAAKALLERGLIKRVHVVTPASLKHSCARAFASGLSTFRNAPGQCRVFSYQGFLKSATRDSLKGSLVIVDEVQNVVSGGGALYRRLYSALVKDGPASMYVLILGGAPMFDRAHEIALTVNLLAPKVPLPVADFYRRYTRGREIVNQEDFMARVHRHVSAFKGAGPAACAARADTTVLCTLSPYQRDIYLAAADGLDLDDTSYSRAFPSGPRMASAVVYPNGGFGRRHRPSDRALLEAFKRGVSKFSAKFAACISNIRAGKTSAFVYSNFAGAGGAADFELCLRAAGITSFGRFAPGRDEHNAKVVADFNSGKIRIILGSPAMKEGVSLKGCGSVHILDPHWSNSRTEQIIGRATPQDGRAVRVFHYASHIESRRTVDRRIMHASRVKKDVTDRFCKLLYAAAVGCPLHRAAAAGGGVSQRQGLKRHHATAKRQGGVRSRKATRAGCPGARQAAASRKCPGRDSKGIAVAGDKIYVDGRSVRSLTLAQLEEVAKKYQARLLPMMRRMDVVQGGAKRG